MISLCRPPPNAILAPNFKFEDMGIGGLDSEFGTIFRRAFASRIFPPGLVEKLGIQHVKGLSFGHLFFLPTLTRLLRRFDLVWTTWNRKNAAGPPNWQNAERSRTQDC